MFFRQGVLTVVGQGLDAGGYRLVRAPLAWNSGLFRFRRPVGQGFLIVDYQVLAHPDHPSRFQPQLARQLPAGSQSRLPAVRISLPRLLWDEFRVDILPAPDFWWPCNGAPELAEGLLESGKLLAGYGLPWLEGSLRPDAAAGWFDGLFAPGA